MYKFSLGNFKNNKIKFVIDNKSKWFSYRLPQRTIRSECSTGSTHPCDPNVIFSTTVMVIFKY